MRKTISIFIISASIILAGSNCSNSQTIETEQILNVTPEILDFGEEGGTAHITVESTSKWYLQIPEEDNWCHCSLNEQENNTVEIKADANTTEQQRSTQILFSSGKLEKMVKVSQQAGKKTPTEEWKLETSMNPSSSLTGADWETVNKYMNQYKFDYTEHSNRATDNDHLDGIHIEVMKDEVLGHEVFKFNIHASADKDGNILILDGDRGKREDRQRNEMKTRTGDGNHEVNGNWGEWQRLEWKFKIPTGFRPTKSFTHIHQLKAQEGNNGSPIITITPRASDSNGKNSRIQVIHNGDNAEATQGTIIDNLPLSDFEDEWIQVTTEMLYTHDGSFYIKMERISDGKVLVEKKFEHIDMWRKGAVDIRNKYGIYRSYGGNLEEDFGDKFPTSGIKDESLYLADFKIYEKNANAQPEAHD